MDMNDLLDQYYAETFKTALDFATDMVKREKELGVAQIRGTLRDMYVRQGNNVDGRGLFGDADIEATIAAYEQVLANHDGHLINTSDMEPEEES